MSIRQSHLHRCGSSRPEQRSNDIGTRYFDVVHPAFPVLDETAVKKAYQDGTLPHTLLCEIYAVSLVSWDLSPPIVASGRSQPDLQYMWDTTVNAMHKDFLIPSISTVLACILDLLGRPITSITYNAINVGSAVALAQSLGLNRNPANWKLDPRQKKLRIKTWWALLIHDTWYVYQRQIQRFKIPDLSYMPTVLLTIIADFV